MQAIKTDITDKYIDLDQDRIPDSPFCKDIYHYQATETHFVQLQYKLQLFDDYREIIGEYVCTVELTSNVTITQHVLDKVMADLAYRGREKFNQEALTKYNKRMFIPRLSTMYIEGLDAA